MANVGLPERIPDSAVEQMTATMEKVSKLLDPSPQT